MYLEDNHKAMGMWMLLLHNVSSSKKKECWFVVNGVPIRYSLREVALISGLNCQSYPHNYLSLGGDSAKFVEKNFGKGDKGGSGKPKKVTLKDVDEKLESMKGKYCKSRLNIDVLYFLANVIVGKSKTGTGAPGVEPFFLRAASDLNLCETFPWGRFAFDENMKDIIRVVEKYHPTVPGAVNVVFPSFILPLEFLAFEAIKVLGSHFRVPCEGADSRCPRMCKTKFKRGDMKGFALSEINAILGDSKDIESVLVPSNAEKEMLDELMDTVDLEYDAEDLIVDGWKSIVLDQKRDIFFEEMYEEDVRSRKSEEKKGEKKPVDQVVQNEPEKLIEVMEGLELLIKTMKEMNEKLDDHGIRMKNVELYLKEGRVRGSSLGFQPYQTTDSRIERERAEMRRREKEKAEKEEKERAEKRMREQAEKEEKERAEKRNREQAEKEEKERAEKRKRELIGNKFYPK